ncbi:MULTISPECIES: aggregation promoting factor surface protein [unclassified Lactobacillus]|uniref:aggregation-promoting factor C-terminal-like domain-containing protein n=1 Tax=unclassified Lactobacillus TaxID=2620435 RepID=UPI000EFA322F|nr:MULTISPECIES: aggregation promoting factor surface protein [unclassified Lactobacillus]RMC25717.1 aggregation promoting factor surface protein [Lactobacillus sp. ESL0247]RMC29529.1 aggregation promoting factor surface protein [Lactobacillus sp. ESL0246]RMC33518.1 aggregation promoting factor surface protein [Lactobacillus sp. ESL0245]
MKKSKSLIYELIAALALSFSFISIFETANNQNIQTVQAARKLSKRERAAKKWIATHESGGRYDAQNGVCYGKYQLNLAYLGGDHSPANQERTADNYVYSRYGSWVNAKNFWIIHHWY